MQWVRHEAMHCPQVVRVEMSPERLAGMGLAAGGGGRSSSATRCMMHPHMPPEGPCLALPRILRVMCLISIPPQIIPLKDHLRPHLEATSPAWSIPVGCLLVRNGRNQARGASAACIHASFLLPTNNGMVNCSPVTSEITSL